MATTDLGKWMITNGGNYNPETTYEQLTMVMYDNSTYITLKTVTGITPSNDGINYILMAQGFSATALSSVTATDSSGLLGDAGNSVSAQSLVDYLADAVATKLLKKTDISTVQTDSNTTVPASSLLKATDDKIGDVTGLPEGVSNLAEAYAQLNSDLSSLSAKFPMFEIYIDDGIQTTVQAAIESLYPNLTSEIVLCRYRLAAGSGVALIYNAGAYYGTCLCVDRTSNRLVCGIYGNSGWSWTFPA